MKLLRLCTLLWLLIASVGYAGERTANNCQTTLNGSITSSQTTLVVASAACFPAKGTFSVAIDVITNPTTYEIATVTAVAGTTFTVVRGEDTRFPGVAHASGVMVTAVQSVRSQLAQMGIGGQSDQVFNVMAAPYDAVGDGVTDDGPAIRAAIAAMPGGLGQNVQGATLYFPPGKTYYINSNSGNISGGYGYECYIGLNKPMTVWAYGATLLFGPTGGAHPAICPNENTNGQPGLGNGTATGNWTATLLASETGTLCVTNSGTACNLVTGVPAGVTSVTVSPAASATNFAVGEWVWVVGGENNNDDQFAEQVQATNGSTGVVTFTLPTPKPLLTGTGCSPPQGCNNNGPGLYHASFGLVFNVNWFGGTLEQTTRTTYPTEPTPSTLLDIAQTQNVLFKDIVAVGQGGMDTGLMIDTTFDNLQYEASCNFGAAFDTEFNSSRVTWKNGQAICDAGGTVNALINISEGSDHVVLDNNLGINHACQSSALGLINMGGGSVATVIKHNKLYQMTSASCGPVLNTNCSDSAWASAFPGTPCTTTVIGNTIWTGENTAVVDGLGTAFIFEGNDVRAMDLAASNAGAALNIGTEPDHIVGNYLYGPGGITKSYTGGQLNAGGLYEGNQIISAESGGGCFGIYIPDPGATAPNPDLTIIGNDIVVTPTSGTGKCLTYANSAHNPNVITGATVPGIGLNQCSTAISQ